MTATSPHSQRRPMALVPARGGSKRFPRKNLAMLGGRPLLAWTIERAMSSGIFDTVFVSSEDGDILETARRFGASVFERPEFLAGDLIPLEPVCLDAAARIEHLGYTDIFLLLPTSPFRTPESIRATWEEHLAMGSDSLMSVLACPHPPQWALRMREGRWLVPGDPENYHKERKALETLYRHDGAYNISRIESLRLSGSLAGPRTLAFPTPTLMESVDIDTPMDLAFAEFLLGRLGADNQTGLSLLPEASISRLSNP